MKILLVEDNRHLTESIKIKLKMLYTVDAATTGNEGLVAAQETQYSLILLDLGLPDMDGQEVCSRLRSLKVKAPILILTARNESKSVIQLLNCGADDYLVKPFNSEELKARIAALLRRSKDVQEEKVIDVDDLKVNITRREVTRSGRPIELRRKEFDILEYLAMNKGRTLTREMILNSVWEAGTEGWNNTVDVHIKYLRDKIDRPFKNSLPLIKTSYGIGYMLNDRKQ